MKKQIITNKSKADRIYFVLFGLIRLKELSKEEYYGICKVGWPIGEELLLNSGSEYTDTAQAGNEVGIIYITLSEFDEIQKGTDKSEYSRFLRRLQKFSFMKKLMRRVNLKKE
eukprot:CAMPEP_0197007904 /NCGR_PEP_ID=MMETSP1380-20130617/42833_1 /TAXON_ID=5936 /ORGANISM="Euplotes crassus, Strain CT5" /LENGTH=112 /DNA_ID=CAMNT_0042428215 /DNA_START=20 /DNA_END=355 /DNA_ORIENTATION=+